MIKVMVCDDLREIREDIISNINSQEDMYVCCTAVSGEEAVEQAVQHHPNVILMDIQMDSRNDGIWAAEQITEVLPECKIIMLTIHDSDDSVVEAYLGGACDYLLKDCDREKIINSIRTVYNQENFLGSLISQKVKKQLYKSKYREVSLIFIIEHISRLTPMEMQVLKGLCAKKKRSEIAVEENISEETVKIHIRHIIKKLGFKNSTEMVLELKKIGVLEWIEMQ